MVPALWLLETWRAAYWTPYGEGALLPWRSLRGSPSHHLPTPRAPGLQSSFFTEALNKPWLHCTKHIFLPGLEPHLSFPLFPQNESFFFFQWSWNRIYVSWNWLQNKICSFSQFQIGLHPYGDSHSDRHGKGLSAERLHFLSDGKHGVCPVEGFHRESRKQGDRYGGWGGTDLWARDVLVHIFAYIQLLWATNLSISEVEYSVVISPPVFILLAFAIAHYAVEIGWALQQPRAGDGGSWWRWQLSQSLNAPSCHLTTWGEWRHSHQTVRSKVMSHRSMMSLLSRCQSSRIDTEFFAVFRGLSQPGPRGGLWTLWRSLRTGLKNTALYDMSYLDKSLLFYRWHKKEDLSNPKMHKA